MTAEKQEVSGEGVCREHNRTFVGDECPLDHTPTITPSWCDVDDAEVPEGPDAVHGFWLDHPDSGHMVHVCTEHKDMIVALKLVFADGMSIPTAATKLWEHPG